MSNGLRQIPVTELELGMYVTKLDRPWTDTPFMFQGFFIHHADEIDVIRRYCKHVVIDAARGAHPTDASQEERTITRVSSLRGPAPTQAPPPTARARKTYERSKSVEAEMPAARAIYEDTAKAASDVIKRLQDTGYLDIDLAQQSAGQVMDSVLRNPDALIWLTRMRSHDAYVYQHSVNSCVWGVAFGRHLGLDRKSLYEIGLGCMLQDVGKTLLPALLLAKTGELSEAEMRVMRSHVEHSAAIMRNTPGITARMLEMVQSHHERFDGSGYPEGRRGNEIPTFAKIGAMVDCYDALISPRPYATQFSPHLALREIYTWRGTLFQPEVVEQFMQVVGAFPTGSMVELNTGAVAVVISQNESRRLRPRLMIILDEKKERLQRFETVDLLYDQPWADAGRFWIEKNLEPDAYGIDPQSLYL